MDRTDTKDEGQKALEAQKISIHDTLVSLRSYFPTKNGANHLYSQWDRCAALHHHVQALRDKVAALESTEPIDDDDQELYNELIHDDIWSASICLLKLFASFLIQF
jgi:hypothetical protein